MLAAMKQKTRYNVRLAARRGVTSARAGDSRPTWHSLLRALRRNRRRDGFIIRPPDYYRDAWGSFMEADWPTSSWPRWRARPWPG